MADHKKDESIAPTDDPAPARAEEVVLAIDAELPAEDDVESLIEPAEAPEVDSLASENVRAGTAADADTNEVAGATIASGADGAVPAMSAAEAAKRGMATREPEHRTPQPKITPRMVVALASGKGGVGKSLIAAGIGVYLAQLGKKVMLVDANLGSGNLHSLLGVEKPRVSLYNFLFGEIKSLEEVAAPTPFKGLGLIPSHDNALGTANPRQAQKNKLVNQLRMLPADYVIIDLPPGTDFNTLDLLLAADLYVVVVTPEPTSIESAFRLIKSAFARRLRSVKGFDRLLTDLQPAAHCGIPTPHQIYEVARERSPNMGEAIAKAMAGFKPRLVVNMTRMRDDLEIGPALAAVGRRHLALPVDYLGYVEKEDVVWVTVRKRRALLVEYPESKVAKDIERVTRHILSRETKERPECIGVPPTLQQQDHYEILGLHPGAAIDEIRRAQRRMRQIYAADSNMVYGIAPPGEVSQMLNRIEEAYATLVDPEKRLLYDKRTLPLSGSEQPATAAQPTTTAPDPSLEAEPYEPMLDPQEPTPVIDRPDMPLITPATEFTGTLLRHVREARGSELQEIADRTKISIAYLRAIEDENFHATPAPVYLKGFIKILARDLKLDPEHVARTYMERYQAAATTTPEP